MDETQACHLTPIHTIVALGADPVWTKSLTESFGRPKEGARTPSLFLSTGSKIMCIAMLTVW